MIFNVIINPRDVRTTVVRHILLQNRAIMARMWRDNSGIPETVHKFKINTDEIYSLFGDYKTLLKQKRNETKRKQNPTKSVK
jgi:hypothetical protein